MKVHKAITYKRSSIYICCINVFLLFFQGILIFNDYLALTDRRTTEDVIHENFARNGTYKFALLPIILSGIVGLTLTLRKNLRLLMMIILLIYPILLWVL